MTANASEKLTELLSGVELLMLDFDGPICNVFAGLPAHVIAERLRQSLRGFGVEIRAELEANRDPLSVYRHAASYGHQIKLEISAELVAAELEAVESATPTLGATEAINFARAAGRRIAVVSNNAAVAVESYLKAHGMAASIDYVAARRAPIPALMKPNPAYLEEAARGLDCAASRCLLIGDSATDIEAARSAEMRAIGYANKPGKAARLREAGADALVSSMEDIALALRQLS